MVGGVDRYYQIARCLRDEDLRADRQFEFSQLDVEASFVERDDVLGFVTRAVAEATMEVAGHDPGEFDRMTWHEAMERFGSDKPDIRFGMELAELTPIFAGTQARVFQAPCVKGICLTGGAETLPRSRIDELVATCQRWGAKGLAWMRVVTAEAGGSALDAGVAKFLSSVEAAGVIEALDARPGDMVFLVADERPVVRHVLGLLRLALGRPPVNDGSFNYLWVLDFRCSRDSAPTAPPSRRITRSRCRTSTTCRCSCRRTDPPEGEALLDLRSQAYDLVLNGWELGSGSVRIHRRDVQQRIFEVLGIAPDDAQERFGFLLDAFRYGAPPHAGFAVGLDRLAALLVGEENIREVIAFPKTQSRHRSPHQRPQPHSRHPPARTRPSSPTPRLSGASVEGGAYRVWRAGVRSSRAGPPIRRAAQLPGRFGRSRRRSG